MAAPRPSYAPSSPLDCLPTKERLLLRMRRRARRRWPVEKLLDERIELRTQLDAVERGRTKLTAKLRQRALEKPATRGVIEQVGQRVEGELERGAETVRHRLVVSDRILSARGVRPWEAPEH